MIGKTNSGGVMPTGSITLSANGTYNITNYSEAVVNVSASAGNNQLDELLLGTLSYVSSITLNGPINSYLFHNQSNLSYCNITTSDNIGQWAFTECSNLTDCKCISMGTSSRVIGQYAFAYCNKLSTPLIGFANLGQYAFNGCAISKIQTNNTSDVLIGDFCFAGGCSNLSDIDITASYLQIGQYAFTNTPIPYVDTRSNFKKTDYMRIYASAFGTCQNLSYVYISSGSNYDAINTYCFKSCYSLELVDLLNVSSIGDSAFTNCSNLSYVNAPMLNDIGLCAFSYCTQLSTLIYSYTASILKLGNSCLAYTALKSFTASNISVNAGSQILQGCSNLKYVSIPNLYQLGSYPITGANNVSYFNCINLRTQTVSLWLSQSLTSFMLISSTMSFSRGFFYNANNLSKVYLLASNIMPLRYSYGNVFVTCPILSSIYVKQSLLTAYQNATNWVTVSSYFNIIY